MLAGLMSTTPRKWLYPAIWVTLVIVFYKSQLKRKHHGIRFTSTNNSTNSSSTYSRLTDYYNSLTHSPPETPSLIIHEYKSVNVSASKKAAVIVETRQSGNIVPLILHFSAVLGPDWPIIVYTDAENFGTYGASDAIKRHQKDGRVVVRPLAEGVWFPNWDSVSDFLTTDWLWHDLAPAEHILIFQSDSVLCANAVRSVEDFFEYDLVGAPISPNWGIGYNGGLSLRRRSTILRVLDRWTWLAHPDPHPEDQWYFARIRDLQDEEWAVGIEDGIKLPTMEIARTFAVETIDFPNPLGLHQPTRFLHAHMLSLDEWCPEYKLATTDRIG